MANTIKQKRGTSDPGASDLVVGELAINTPDGGVFTKTDGGTVVEVGSGGGGGASEINDLSDAKTANSGALIGIGTGALENNTSATSTSLAIGLDALNDQTTGTHNIAIGNGALSQLTTGHTNVAVGRNAGANATSGNTNVFVGMNAGKSDSGGGSTNNSTAVGEGSLQFVSSGNDITAIGYRALRSVTSGSDNTALGYQAGDAVTTGTNNLFMGHDAGTTFTTGSNCTAIGHNAQPSSNTVSNEITFGDANVTSLRIPGLQSGASDGQVLTFNSTNGNITLADAGGGASAINDLSDAVTKDSGVTIGLGTGALANDDDTVNNNTALGYNALNANTSGAGGVAVGYEAGSATTTNGKGTFVGFECGQNVTGNHVVAVGYQALKGATGTNTAFNNTAIGYQAGTAVTSSGARNSFLGYACGKSLTSGVGNVLFGSRSGVSLTTGSNNVVIGYEACGDGSGQLTTGSNNIVIGKHAKSSSATSSNEITLGNTDITSFRIPGLQSGATNGQVLTYNSTNGDIEFADAGGGGASAINDLSDAKTDNSGAAIGIGTGTLAADDGGNSTVAIGKDDLNDQTSGNFNCAVGNEAFSLLTTSAQSAAFGVYAGRRATGGSNTFIGYSAGEGVSGSASASYCTAVGEKSMENFTSGSDHTAVGYRSLRNVTTGVDNVSVGYQSGDAVTTGSSNTFLGHEAGTTFTTGSNCTALGHNAQPSSNTVSNEITLGDASVDSLRIPGLQSGASDGQVLTFNSSNGNITLADAGGGGLFTEDVNKNLYGGSNAFLNPTLTGSDKADNNVAIGERCMMDITGGDRNVALGANTMKEITMGSYNVGIGEEACGGNSAAAFTGQDNVGIGRGALDSVTTGDDNIALGLAALDKCTTGSYNIALGKNCLKDTTTGEYNIAMGEGSQRYASGSNNISMGYRTAHNISGSNNVLIGASILTSSSDSLSGSNNTLIGKSASPSSASVSNEMTLGHSGLNTLRCNQTSITSLSDGRDKINVAELGEGLDFVSRLKPVKFEWKTRDGNIKDGTCEAGFIAQDLQQLQKDTDTDYLKLVMDSNPDRLEASYGKLVPILVRAIQELKSEVEQLKANV